MRDGPHARGLALVEALVAAALVAATVAAAVHLAVSLRLSARDESDHVDALRAAEAVLETARARPVPGLSHAGPVRTASTSPRDPADPAAGDVEWQQDLHADAAARDLAWIDVTADTGDARRGPRPVTLHSALDRSAAVLAGAVSLDRAAGLWRVEGRAVTLPVDAQPLGGGRLLWRPDPTRPLAFVFDAATGRIVARCADASAPDGCIATDALLLSGAVRASTRLPPDAAAPADAPPPLGVRLSLQRGTLLEPGCVVVADGPAALAYHCAIAPEGGRWTGRSEIVPTGWTLGPGAEALRVCRYVAAVGADASPAERQAAHPARYDDVDRPLMQQNFLLARGDATCPVADGVATAAHQP